MTIMLLLILVMMMLMLVLMDDVYDDKDGVNEIKMIIPTRNHSQREKKGEIKIR